MNRSITIASLLALLAAGSLFGASSMTYTVELDGDNHAATWETGVNTAYTRGVNGDADGKQYNVGDNLNWAVLVEVGGAHSNPGGLGDGLVPGGAANMVFDIELRSGTANGPLAQIGHATLVNGVATTGGFWSSINDGDCESVRCVLEGQASPELNAAYAIAFNVSGNGANGGRLFDNANSGGPFVDFWHYPSAAGLPVNSTAPQGKLVGMGAGYKEFKPISAGGQNTAGVGLTANSGSCVALGIKPIFEGQIKTTGLPAGTYVLVLKASTGNNVLPGHDANNPICSFGPSGRFAMAPNNVVEDTITFQLNSAGCGNPAIALQTANAVRTHGGAGTFAINLLAAPKIEPRQGTVRIEATYNVASVQVSGAVSASSGSASSSASGNKITVDVSNPTINQQLLVSFTAQDAGAGCAANTVNTSLCVLYAPGNANSDNAVNIFDLVVIRNVLNTVTNGTTFKSDVNADGNINIFDLVVTRNNLNTSGTLCP